MRALIPLFAVSLAVLAGACGGGGAADVDLAAAVPRDAPAYMEVVVRPEGDLRSDALAAAGKVLRTNDPEARIQELLRELGDDFDYERDLKPWLGERAAFWLSGRQSGDGDPGAAVVVAATDLEAAEESIDAARERSRERLSARSHAGVDYEVDADGFGVAFAEDFVLAGSEPELRRTIEALQGDALADDDRYRRAVDGLEDERLAHFYAEPRRLLDLARQADPESAAAVGQLEALIPFGKLPALAGAFMADGSQLTVDVQADSPRAAELGALAGGTGSTPLLEELPAESWYAQGSQRLGESVRVSLEQFGGALAERQVEQRLGIDLERDFISWAGDAVAFVRGESLDAIDGGVVIEVTDGDAATAAFGRIVGGLRSRGRLDPQPVDVPGAEMAFEVGIEAPKPLVLARGDGKVVVAYGRDAAAAALDPDERLGGSERHKRARELLGDGVEPSYILWLPSVTALVDAASDDPGWSRARPYFEAYDAVSIGGGVGGGRAGMRIAAGLR